MTLDELYAIICDRRDNPRQGSYTQHLLQTGQEEIMKKVGEEAIEVIVAAQSQGEQRLVEESADLLYHLLVLWARENITPGQVMAELAQRHQAKSG